MQRLLAVALHAHMVTVFSSTKQKERDTLCTKFLKNKTNCTGTALFFYESARTWKPKCVRLTDVNLTSICSGVSVPLRLCCSKESLSSSARDW